MVNFLLAASWPNALQFWSQPRHYFSKGGARGAGSRPRIGFPAPRAALAPFVGFHAAHLMAAPEAAPLPTLQRTAATPPVPHQPQALLDPDPYSEAERERARLEEERRLKAAREEEASVARAKAAERRLEEFRQRQQKEMEQQRRQELHWIWMKKLHAAETEAELEHQDVLVEERRARDRLEDMFKRGEVRDCVRGHARRMGLGHGRGGLVGEGDGGSHPPAPAPRPLVFGSGVDARGLCPAIVGSGTRTPISLEKLYSAPPPPSRTHKTDLDRRKQVIHKTSHWAPVVLHGIEPVFAQP